MTLLNYDWYHYESSKCETSQWRQLKLVHVLFHMGESIDFVTVNVNVTFPEGMLLYLVSFFFFFLLHNSYSK